MTIALATVASGCVSFFVPVLFEPGLGFAEGTPMAFVLGMGAGELGTGIPPDASAAATPGASIAGGGAPAAFVAYAAGVASAEAHATSEKAAIVAAAALNLGFMGK